MTAFYLPFFALLTAQPATQPPGPLVSPSIPSEADGPGPKERFVPAKLDADATAIVSGMNQFGLDIYGDVRGKRGDLAISPASICTAFGLAYAGARGQTAKEIASVLHYPAIPDFHGSFGDLLHTMDLHQNGRTLTVNNAIWLQRGLKVRPEYVALVDRDYGAGLQWADYKSDAVAARNQINRWVEEKTNNRIRNLLGPPDVRSDTRSILVNTIYFKSDWADPFEKSATKDGTFTLASGAKVLRALMNRQGDYAYTEEPGFKVLAMPYRGYETEMVVMLPNAPGGLATLERSFDAKLVSRLLAKMQLQHRVLLTLPKFRIERRYDLRDVLASRGMQIALSDRSDFSGMKMVDRSSPDRENWNLKISSVVHQVFVEVEEKGTEAAAATAIGMVITGGVMVPHPKVFRADHPFLFLIRDRRTNAILFIGRFTGETA